MMSRKDLVIRKVGVRVVRIPMQRPLVANLRLKHWLAVVVDIETEGDVRGLGYICPYLDSAVAAHVRVINMLEKHMRAERLPRVRCSMKVCAG